MSLPSDNRALDIPQKNAKQALAEDKYEDCIACKVTGIVLMAI